MNRFNKTALSRIGLSGSMIVVSVAAVTLIIASCSTDNQGGTTGAASTGHVEKGGAQLWAENCQRCHNTRSPSSYNDAQWEVAMMHMRVRANLTPEEHKKILEFLKQGK